MFALSHHTVTTLSATYLIPSIAGIAEALFPKTLLKFSRNEKHRSILRVVEWKLSFVAAALAFDSCPGTLASDSSSASSARSFAMEPTTVRARTHRNRNLCAGEFN